MDRYDKIEICNLLFGCSRGEHLFPEREIEGSVEWRALCGVLGIDSYGHTRKDNPHRNARGGYDDGTICVNPYYWGNDEEEAAKPNFLDRAINLEIWWYKYPFRDSYMNWQMSAEQLTKYFGGLALLLMAEKQKEDK